MSLLYPWQRIDVGGSWFSDYGVSFVKLVDPHAKVSYVCSGILGEDTLKESCVVGHW